MGTRLGWRNRFIGMAYLPEFDRPKNFSVVPTDRDREEEEGEEAPELTEALIDHLLATGGQRVGVSIAFEGMKFLVYVERLDE